MNKATRIVPIGILLCAATSAALSETAVQPIVRLDQNAPVTSESRYRKEMIVTGDGSYLSAIVYTSADRRMVAGLWESGPGILRTDYYPHDEYCRVVSGHLVVINRDGGREEFNPGDTFVIPKGWAGAWNMTTRFKKQYVAFELERER